MLWFFSGFAKNYGVLGVFGPKTQKNGLFYGIIFRRHSSVKLNGLAYIIRNIVGARSRFTRQLILIII